MSQQSGLSIANKSNFGNVPRPSGNNLSYFLNANDGDALYAMKSDGSVFPVNAGGDLTARIQISSADILTLFSNPKVIVPSPGPGKAILAREMVLELVYGTTPYGGAGTINLITNTASSAQLSSSAILTSPGYNVRRCADTTPTGPSVTVQVVANKDLLVQVPSVNPTSGDSTLNVLIFYRIVNIPLV